MKRGSHENAWEGWVKKRDEERRDELIILAFSDVFDRFENEKYVFIFV